MEKWRVGPVMVFLFGLAIGVMFCDMYESANYRNLQMQMETMRHDYEMKFIHMAY